MDPAAQSQRQALRALQEGGDTTSLLSPKRNPPVMPQLVGKLVPGVGGIDAPGYGVSTGGGAFCIGFRRS